MVVKPAMGVPVLVGRGESDERGRRLSAATVEVLPVVEERDGLLGGDLARESRLGPA